MATKENSKRQIKRCSIVTLNGFWLIFAWLFFFLIRCDLCLSRAFTRIEIELFASFDFDFEHTWISVDRFNALLRRVHETLKCTMHCCHSFQRSFSLFLLASSAGCHLALVQSERNKINRLHSYFDAFFYGRNCDFGNTCNHFLFPSNITSAHDSIACNANQYRIQPMISAMCAIKTPAI